MKPSFACLLLIFLSVACQKAFFPSVLENTPANNFEEMWKGYDQWYGLFDVKNIRWNEVHDSCARLVREGMSEKELYGVLSGMITPLNDPHVFLQPTSGGLPRYESSVFFRNNKVQRNFSLDVLKSSYLPSLVTVDEHFHYGILAGNIGYIHFGEFPMPVSFYRMQLDKILDTLKNVKALVVDIRDHAGGDDEVSRYVAGRFAAETKLFMTVRKRNGPRHQDFTAPAAWYVQPEGNMQYTRPVMLLTTRWTTSAGETFTWAMNTQQHITQLGDTTAGGFSDVISRELPNGWLYFVGVGDYRNAGGASEEGKGIAPAVYLVNTIADIKAGKDRVLEKAMELLNN
jgi:C-terminal processing protease CtpA/Prc